MSLRLNITPDDLETIIYAVGVAIRYVDEHEDSGEQVQRLSALLDKLESDQRALLAAARIPAEAKEHPVQPSGLDQRQLD